MALTPKEELLQRVETPEQTVQRHKVERIFGEEEPGISVLPSGVGAGYRPPTDVGIVGRIDEQARIARETQRIEQERRQSLDTARREYEAEVRHIRSIQERQAKHSEYMQKIADVSVAYQTARVQAGISQAVTIPLETEAVRVTGETAPAFQKGLRGEQLSMEEARQLESLGLPIKYGTPEVKYPEAGTYRHIVTGEMMSALEPPSPAWQQIRETPLGYVPTKVPPKKPPLAFVLDLPRRIKEFLKPKEKLPLYPQSTRMGIPELPKVPPTVVGLPPGYLERIKMTAKQYFERLSSGIDAYGPVMERLPTEIPYGAYRGLVKYPGEITGEAFARVAPEREIIVPEQKILQKISYLPPPEFEVPKAELPEEIKKFEPFFIIPETKVSGKETTRAIGEFVGRLPGYYLTAGPVAASFLYPTLRKEIPITERIEMGILGGIGAVKTFKYIIPRKKFYGLTRIEWESYQKARKVGVERLKVEEKALAKATKKRLDWLEKIDVTAAKYGLKTVPSKEEVVFPGKWLSIGKGAKTATKKMIETADDLIKLGFYKDKTTAIKAIKEYSYQYQPTQVKLPSKLDLYTGTLGDIKKTVHLPGFKESPWINKPRIIEKFAIETTKKKGRTFFGRGIEWQKGISGKPIARTGYILKGEGRYRVLKTFEIGRKGTREIGPFKIETYPTGIRKGKLWVEAKIVRGKKLDPLTLREYKYETRMPPQPKPKRYMPEEFFQDIKKMKVPTAKEFRKAYLLEKGRGKDIIILGGKDVQIGKVGIDIEGKKIGLTSITKREPFVQVGVGIKDYGKEVIKVKKYTPPKLLGTDVKFTAKQLKEISKTLKVLYLPKIIPSLTTPKIQPRLIPKPFIPKVSKPSSIPLVSKIGAFTGLGLYEKTWTLEEQFLLAKRKTKAITPLTEDIFVKKAFPGFAQPTTGFEGTAPVGRFKDLDIERRFEDLGTLGISPRVKVLTSSIEKKRMEELLKIKGALKPEERLGIFPKGKTIQRISQRLRPALKTKVTAMTAPTLAMALGVTVKAPKSRLPPPPKPPIPKIIIPKLDLSIGRKRIRRKPIRRRKDLFIPEVRRKGKWIPVTAPIPFAKAFEVGKRRVRETLAASLRIIEVPTGRIVPLAPLFPMWRVAKKDVGVIVQKKRALGPYRGRLTTLAERRELQFFRSSKKKTSKIPQLLVPPLMLKRKGLKKEVDFFS